MTAQLIDGKALAANVREQVSRQVQARRHDGKRAPGLAVILVGAVSYTHLTLPTTERV